MPFLVSASRSSLLVAHDLFRKRDPLFGIMRYPSRTAGVDAAVGIDRLIAAGRNDDGGGVYRCTCGCGRPYGDGASGRAPRHAGIAHGRERPADARVGRCDQAGVVELSPVRREEDHESGGGCHGEASEHAAGAGHFFAPMTWPAGISSISASATNSTLLASAGGLKVKASAATCGFGFHSLMRNVYCGAPVTCLLVMTYLRGMGRGPISTQICISTSGVRKARCSHSLPSTTPCPICLPSTTSAA